MMNTTSVDAYLRDGCGRCEKYRTPACKVHLWARPLEALRALVLESELVEEMKWGSPCYTLGGKNVLMIASFKEYCALQFFKGAALEDPDGVLESAGPNSQHVRFIKFRSGQDVAARKKAAKRLVAQAIELERAGGKVAPRSTPDAVPEELARRLAAQPALRRAFDALTPGRRRSHVLHVSGAKQAETRERRVDRCAEAILAGRGFNER
ncbi:MAG: YdeI/OmpD-associated family protein [Myxococcaceae bacterium]|nr:YdeI/OmpD-associated family protein [Myxococcaceae bacterium]